MRCTPRVESPTGVLVVRLWWSEDSGLCARLQAAGEPNDEPTTYATCVGGPATVSAVRSWLEQWAATAARSSASDRPSPA